MRYALAALAILLAIPACSFGSQPGRGPEAARLGLDLYAALDSAGLCHGREINCQQAVHGSVVIHFTAADGAVVSIQANRSSAGAPATVFLWTQH